MYKNLQSRSQTAEFKLLAFSAVTVNMYGTLFEEVSIFVVWHVPSLASPSSNIEAWPYGTSLRFASLLHLGH